MIFASLVSTKYQMIQFKLHDTNKNQTFVKINPIKNHIINIINTINTINSILKYLLL